MSEGIATTTSGAPAPAGAPNSGGAGKQASAPLTQAGASPVIQQGQGDAGAGGNTSPGSQQTDPKAPHGADKPTTQAPPEYFELKVNGKKVKLTRDELLQHASLGLASNERFEEAARLKKQAEAAIGKLKDPKNVINALQDPALGLTKDQIRQTFEEWYAREFIEPEQLSPEQLKLREAEEKLKRYEEAERQREEEKQKAHLESLTAKAREEIQTQIIEALDTGKLPKTNFTMKRLAYWIERNTANGFDAPTAVLVAQVKKDIESNLREMVQASDGEVLIQMMGDEIIKKVRKYDLEQLRLAREKRAMPVVDATQDPMHGAPQTQSDRREREPVDVAARLRELQRTGRY